MGWDVKEPTERIKEWFAKARKLGITVTIVSNNNEERVSSFSKDLEVDFIFKAQNLWAKHLKSHQTNEYSSKRDSSHRRSNVD